MKTLYLPLKKEWYEMIEAGIKKEEYRERSPYWVNRLRDKDRTCADKAEGCECNRICWKIGNCGLAHFDVVCFSYGYTKRRMLWECKGITIGQGRKEWGAPDHETFIIKLGERL